VDGGGLVGPNLCDDYWLHGSNFVDNLQTIWNGVPAKGMVTWKGTLKPSTIYAAGSFIYSLRGTHPQNPKPPENLAPVKTGPSEFE
jgi:cytochrome c oxidase cbb3-type subunit 3